MVNSLKRAMRNIRLMQVFFLLAAIAGVVIVSIGGDGPLIGGLVIGFSVVGFFVLVAVVGWVRANE